MRILEICLAKSLGGLELYFHRCNKWLAKSNLGFHMALVSPNSRLEALCKQYRIPCETFNRKGLIGDVRRLITLIKKNNIKIVHVHHKDDLLLCSIARWSYPKFKLVHTRQMQIPHSKKDPYHYFVYHKIDLFITITNKLKEEVIDNIPIDPQKVVRLYYGVSAPKILNDGMCGNKFSSDKFNMGVFSRIEHQKGQHIVIKALSILKSKGHNLMLYFWGDIMDQEYKQEIETLIKNEHLEGLVSFEGFHEEASSFMPCLNLIILPSQKETFGLVLAEAMRAKVPVIGTNAGGVTEIIDDGKNGLLFEWNNPEQLAEQIEKFYLDEALRNKLAEAGKQKADKYFDEQKHFATLGKLLKQLIKA